jgi:hypothetical protein
MLFGFIGGVLTAIFGRYTIYSNPRVRCGLFVATSLRYLVRDSGLDICTFSVLTLLFRVSEKTATPTTVVLQAWNCTVGMLAKFILMDGTLPTHHHSHAMRRVTAHL